LLERSIATSLTPRDEAAAEGLRWTRGMLRAATRDPALRAVWYRVNQESEERLREVVAALAGPGADPLEVRLVAAAATDAIRIALESWAETGTGADTGDGTTAGDGTATGRGPDAGVGIGAGVGAGAGHGTDAGAPVRGEGSPAALAVRCLRELTGGMRLLRDSAE
ncbi:hypothetical protein ACFCY7_38205, partial [Streptomyces sp. NPDC056361]